MTISTLCIISCFIFDPVLRGPLFTCVFMGLSGGLLGIWLFFQRQLLIGEVLSHSIFPGMIVGAIIFSMIGAISTSEYSQEMCFIVLGGIISAYLAIFFMRFIIKRKLATEDSALSFTLSTTFGVGLLAISILQTEYPTLWRKLMGLLMGQAATIPNHFISISGWFFCVIFIIFLLFRRSFFSYLFDKQFATIHKLISPRIEQMVIIAIIIASILGVRLMGVALLSAIFTFPPVIARFFSDKAATVTVFSTLFSGFACAAGVFLSHTLSSHIQSDIGKPLWLPTGPLVVILMSLCFLIALFFSPKHGLVMQFIRRLFFHWRCAQENILKFFWKACAREDSQFISWDDIKLHSPLSYNTFSGYLHYYILVLRGYIKKDDRGVLVTAKSLIEGRKLVRLHRLWELYLVEYCGMDRSTVHPSAEEMEHILTPEMEEELMLLLHDPNIDPHQQPIPVQVEKILRLDRCCSQEE